MLSLGSRSSNRSPIHEVPYDVLREIFLHCLPQYPLDTPQPNTTVAPILLCQICSSWRAIALASPSLWSHLLFCITTIFVDSGSWAFPQKEIDFIRWWKRNQGSMAPFLRLRIKIAEYANQEFSLADDGLAVLIKYVTSAQYLQVDPLFGQLDRFQDEVKIKDEIVFSNLHTLVTYGPGYDIDYYFYATRALVRLTLTRTPSLLRYLAINGDGLVEQTFIPSQWAALTHLSMSNIIIPLKSWFSLVRTVTDLQWAYILLDGIYNIGQYTEPPAKCTLPQLSMLFITYNLERGEIVELPLTLLFSTLYLPALRTLSLSSTAGSWEDHRAIHEIYTVLRSAPSITTLTLRGYGFLSLHEDDCPTALAGIGDVEPIWDHVHLTHLRLQLPHVDIYHGDRAGSILDTFVRNIFLSSRSWLALDDIACSIKWMTLIAAEKEWGPSIKDIRDLTMASIQKQGRGVSNIEFKIISDLEDDTGAEVWREWGSRTYSI